MSSRDFYDKVFDSRPPSNCNDWTRARINAHSTIDAAVQLLPLNFVAVDAGYANLGEVSDYIPEIVFTALIVDRDWALQNRKTIVSLLAAIIDATRLVYDPANDALLVELTMELTQADENYGRRALQYMREVAVFPRDLSIPRAAFAKSLELMHNAKLADDALVSSAQGSLDDSYRQEATGRGNC
jgi:ABC-type nitrate/sulfonate/bicarbonate transport system substrate-binding protein